MAINKNHEFEELDGVKCGIVEKNVSANRAAFLKQLLEVNRYEVKVVAAAPPKKAAAPAAPVAEGTDAVPAPVAEPPAPELFTVGVTDYTFNPVNAIFGRMLKTADGHIVTLAYWNQQDAVSRDDVPYYEKA